MKLPDDLDPELKQLWESLLRLHHRCRNDTKKKYNRINPFYEDLFDWSERGSFWAQKNKGITIYNSATLIGDIKIGAHTWIGPFSLLDGGGGLEIGSYCSISTGCQVLTHDTVNWALSGGKMQPEHAATKIGDCCFLGSHAIVTKGVTIGNHCLIAAGAVVTRDIDDFTIAGGVPSSLIGRVEIDSSGNVELVYNNSREYK
ncbi:MAG: acyltransferase [Desulfobacterales bacterium]|jgi:acetyltransferase-like isoleucine patch superfamily enzyme